MIMSFFMIRVCVELKTSGCGAVDGVIDSWVYEVFVGNLFQRARRPSAYEVVSRRHQLFP